MKVVCVLVQGNEKNFQAFAEACGRFSPQIAVREREAVFIEIEKSRNLFSAKSLLQRLKTLAERFGFEKIRLGAGASASEALAQARYFSVTPLPLEALRDYASPFEEDLELEKRLSDCTLKLRLFGVKSVADFLKLPSKSLVSRFGQDITQVHAVARGEQEIAWKGFHPEPLIFEKAPMNDGIQGDLQGMVFVLKTLVDRAMARLRGRGERASIVQIELELENWSTLQNHKKKWSLDLPLPQGSVAGLLPILQEYLSYHLQREPLEAPVQSIRLDILESVPGAGRQRDFFEKHEEEKEAWNSLVARLCQKLGTNRVFVALPVEQYAPEKAYAKTYAHPHEQQERPEIPFPLRPSRVLPEPRRMEVFGNTLRLTQSGQVWEASPHWIGPERITTGWWDQQIQRDYFKVPTREGEQLWIFKDQAATYLHGFFD